MTVTPLMDAEMFFPADVARTLVITQGTYAPAHYLLETGQTLTIANIDAVRPYNVYLASEPGGYTIDYDYTLETEDGITFGIGQRAATITLPPGAVLTLTAGRPPEWMPQTLALRFAYNDSITYRADIPSIKRYTLAPGGSVIFTNEGDEPLPMLLLSDTQGDTLDYLRYNVYGEIASFGLQRATRLYLEPGEPIHFTNPGNEPFFFVYPTAWYKQGLDAGETETPALFRRTLKEGEWLRFDNTSAVNALTFHMNETFDFTVTDTDNRLLAYGIQNAGFITLQQRERLTVQPSNAEPLDVIFPYAWQPRTIRMATVANPPLFHITVRPNETVVLRNLMGARLELSNNSRHDGAGFYTRDGEHLTAVPTLGTHAPVYGRPIVLNGDQTLTLTVRGATLHIWMPFTQARQLRFLENTTAP
jgi:hypothetical protein